MMNTIAVLLLILVIAVVLLEVLPYIQAKYTNFQWDKDQDKDDD